MRRGVIAATLLVAAGCESPPQITREPVARLVPLTAPVRVQVASATPVAAPIVAPIPRGPVGGVYGERRAPYGTLKLGRGFSSVGCGRG